MCDVLCQCLHKVFSSFSPTKTNINTTITSLEKKKFKRKEDKWGLAVLCTDIFDTVIDSHLHASLSVPYYKEIMLSSVSASPVARAGYHLVQYCGQEKNFLKLLYQSALSLGLSALQSASSTHPVSIKSMKTFIQLTSSSTTLSTFQMAILPIDYSQGLASSPDFSNREVITTLCDRSIQLIDKILEVSSLLASPTLLFAMSTFFETAECSR